MSKVKVRDRVVLPAFLVLLVLAFLVLALLQYRWTNKISEVTGLRIGSNLKSMMTNWHIDLFRQLSELPIALQVGPDSGARDDWHDYLQRYKEWERTADDPRLAQAVYFWETSTRDKPRLLRLNVQSMEIEEASVAPELQQLLKRLQANSESLSAGLRAWELTKHPAPVSPNGVQLSLSKPRRNDVITGWQFDENLPAVAHPIVHHSLPGKKAASRNATAVDWILVVFDADAIQSELIPQLAQRYFGNPLGLQYKVAVIAGNPPKIMYASDPDFGITTPTEASMDIFGPAPRSVEGGVWDPIRGGSSLSGTEWRSFSAPLWFPVIEYAGESEVWKLVIQHRNDSVNDVLAGIRRRNLLFGLGVLGVLAAAMAMLLIATHRAQTLSKLQMQFVASVSHELRTPLAVLSSATENIADGIVQDPEHLRQYRSIMSKQVRQLSDLVEQVLLFAATREVPSNYKLKAVPVRGTIESVVDELLGFIEQNRVRVQLSVPDDLPDVWAEPSVLSQCLRNLVVNAVKYSGENRWLGIEARLEIQGPRREEVQVIVRDRGLGIAQSELNDIFKPFYRSPSITATNIHGTGLGLPLTKTLIERIGGRITVETELGSGSAFTLHLELAANQNKTPAGGGDVIQS